MNIGKRVHWRSDKTITGKIVDQQFSGRHGVEYKVEWDNGDGTSWHAAVDITIIG